MDFNKQAFLTRGNSSCQQHIRQHYNVYKQKCLEQKIPENHWAIPWNIWNQMEAEKTNTRNKQTMLAFEKLKGPHEFTREGVLHAITQLIALNDQVHTICCSVPWHSRPPLVTSAHGQHPLSELPSCNETKVDEN